MADTRYTLSYRMSDGNEKIAGTFVVPQGENGIDALQYMGSVTYSNVNSTVTVPVTDFNRTPEVGDKFIGIYFNDQTAVRGIGGFQVTAISGNAVSVKPAPRAQVPINSITVYNALVGYSFDSILTLKGMTDKLQHGTGICNFHSKGYVDGFASIDISGAELTVSSANEITISGLGRYVMVGMNEVYTMITLLITNSNTLYIHANGINQSITPTTISGEVYPTYIQ